MSESEQRPGAAASGAGEEMPAPGSVSGEALAARLLAAQRVLARLDADADTRMRLHSRLIAICASLKLPGADWDRGARRLDQLLADAERAEGATGSF